MTDTSAQQLRAAAAPQPQTASHEDEIIKYIAQFMPLSEEVARGIVQNMNFQTFKKGGLLLREGQAAKFCYFVLKGCVRQYFMVDGEEKTTHFYTEGQPVTPYEGAYREQPSKYFLACIEDTVLSVSTPEAQVAFFEKFPHLEPARQMAMAEEMGKSQEMLSNYILNSPEARYLNLLKTRPDLLDRVPQYQLASYLGIKPESLSRIRKRIMLK